jgi:3-oxoacyl-[acyl-carrier protein] reductase
VTGALHGRVALLTGGAGPGIGQAVAHRLAAEGAAIVLTDIDVERTEAVTESIRDAVDVDVVGLPLDVADRRATQAVVGRALAELGRIDILVNSAAANTLQPVDAMPLELVDHIFAVTFFGAYDLIRLCLPGMYERGSGSIVNISTVTASYGGAAGEGAYSAAKAALNSITRTVAREGGSRGVRANAINSGAVTDDPESLTRLAPPEFWDRVLEETPLGRFGAPREIADLVAFLASDQSSFITGATIAIGGGRFMTP